MKAAMVLLLLMIIGLKFLINDQQKQIDALKARVVEVSLSRDGKKVRCYPDDVPIWVNAGQAFSSPEEGVKCVDVIGGIQ